MRNFLWKALLFAVFSFQIHFGEVRSDDVVSETCSVASTNENDPNLKEFIYNVGDGPQSFMAYVEPDVNEFYKETNDGSSSSSSYSKVTPKFNGLAGKFINMSNKKLDFYWEQYQGGPAHIMRHYTAFSCGGTGTFPTHRFFFTPENEPDNRLFTMTIGNYPDNLYVYDPYLVEGDKDATERNLQQNLNEKERSQYDLWTKTLLFNEQYKNFTGRSYLANFGSGGPRKPPSHFMWRADYFGQEHWVTTKETHFNQIPPQESLQRIKVHGSARILKDSDERNLAKYRVLDDDNNIMNMTMKVLSVAPRVFEIKNFMSAEECDHIIDLAGGITLSESTTGDVGSNANGKRLARQQTKVRTSRNSWVSREQNLIIDSIYRRAADLIRIDESLLRLRSPGEQPQLATKRSISETLQLVHYDVSQEYTAHHDFGYSDINDNSQNARFATILFYLNDNMVGGETSFPRWVNGETFHELKVKPEKGKAILFYDQLPDGNMDDFSQHAAKPIIEGEKFLINLWVWDPIYND